MKTIPQARRDALAATATTLHDLNGILATIHRIASDWTTLRAEGRTQAASGAEASLAKYVRRLCATAASSRTEAEDKIVALDRLRQVYHGGSGPANKLMGAMVDAAIAIEAEEWLGATHRH